MRRRANGGAIRAARIAQNLTLRELADRVGWDAGHLSRVERGERAASELLVDKLATALGMRTRDLTEPAVAAAA